MLIQQENDKKKGDKKGRNKKASKSKSSQRKNTKKTNVPQGGNDLITKLYATMEKHRDVSVSINFDILFFFFFFIFHKIETMVYELNVSNHPDFKQLTLVCCAGVLCDSVT